MTILRGDKIKVGSKWKPADGGNRVVVVEEVRWYPASDHEENHWYEVYYSWEKDGVKYTHDKDAFSFQCRYCLIEE
jgi:hypothetical protein